MSPLLRVLEHVTRRAAWLIYLFAGRHGEPTRSVA